MVKIIMPAHNAEKTIKESIDSVLAQSYEDWVLVIIDDASKDKTPALVRNEAAKDKRIQLISKCNQFPTVNAANTVNTANTANTVNFGPMGVSAARNLGIFGDGKGYNHDGKGYANGEGYANGKGYANGEVYANGVGGDSLDNSKWLAFLDADDIWHKDKLTNQLKFIEETGAAISYTATAYMNEASEMYSYVLRAKKELTHKMLLRQNLMSCSSVMVRRDVMIPFPEGYMHEDYAVWLEIVRKVGCAYGLDQPLLTYRISAGSKSSGRFSSAKMIYNSYRHAGYNDILAAALTVRYARHSIRKRRRILATLN